MDKLHLTCTLDTHLEFFGNTDFQASAMEIQIQWSKARSCVFTKSQVTPMIGQTVIAEDSENLTFRDEEESSYWRTTFVKVGVGKYRWT